MRRYPVKEELPIGRWKLFQNAEFFRLWSIGALSNMIRWIELLAVGLFVYDLTDSPFQVAMMTILRLVPFACFGALAGTLTIRFNYRHVMLFGIAAMIFIVTVLSLLSAANQLSLWHIAVGVFLSGMFWVLDFTVRRTSLGGSVSESSVGHAMGLDALTNNGTRALGPALAGIFIQWVGLTGVYVTSVVAYIVALLLTLTLRPRTKTTKLGDKSIMSSFRGIRPVLKAHPLLNGILMATLVLNLWGLPFIAMIPVIGKKILGLDAFYVGLLMSSEGCGALVGALLITSIGQVRHYRRIFASGMCLYLLAILVFSQSTALLTSVICLAFVGLGIAGFAAMQSALIILITPVASRGLMMGLVSMCIGLGAPLGLLHIGLLANWLGATHAVTILACQGAVATCFVFWKWPFLWNIQQLSKISKI